LPWRTVPPALPDPYAVWLSEIMLQQTTVPTVKAYYEKFLAKWPRVADLAAAPLEEVLAAWAGLGYYARARNLHACAKEVVARFEGRFPATEKDLLTLPGIGPYTAAAIAAIAFDQRAVVIDGNVERILTRLFVIEEPLPKSKRLIYERGELLTPQARTGDFAQGMMDLGASICTPSRPKCFLCPYHPDCQAYALGDPERYPVKLPKKERPKRWGTIFYARTHSGLVLVRTRPSKGLLGGMTEFPGSDWVTREIHEETHAPDLAG